MCNFHLCVYDELHACLIKATFDTKESPEIFGWTSKDFRGSLISSLTPKCQRILPFATFHAKPKKIPQKGVLLQNSVSQQDAWANWSYLTVANRVFQSHKKTPRGA